MQSPGRMCAAVDRIKTISPRTVLILLLVALAGYRLTLVGRGQMYWADERCYLPALDLTEAIERGELSGAWAYLFEARGDIDPARPGFVLISLIPAAAQRTAAALGLVTPGSRQYFEIVSYYNVLISLAVTLVVYALSRLWTDNAWLSVLVTAVYSLTVSANVWIRHMVPYNGSLLLFLIALWLLFDRPRQDGAPTARPALAGILTAIAYTCYPGHYAFVLLNGTVALMQTPRRWTRAAAFFACGVAVATLTELVSHLAGHSYLRDLSRLSGRITMGDPKEGFVFLWHYLKDVEGVAGVGLFVLFCTLLATRLWRRDPAINRSTRVTMLAATSCYLLHAGLGVFAGRMVFYGRVSMIFLPFLVGGAVLALQGLPSVRLRRISAAGLLVASLAAFANFATEYGKLEYPAEFLQKTMDALGRNVHYPPDVLWGYVDGDMQETVEHLDPELTMVTDTRPDGCTDYVRLASHASVHRTRPPYIGVNLKYLWYVRERWDRFTPPDDYLLVASAPHPEQFPAAWYEGRKPWERRRIAMRHYQMRIYQRSHDESHVESGAESSALAGGARTPRPE